VAGVFLVGCAVGGASSQLVVPKASAQQTATLPQWEYKCGTVPEGGTTTAFANELGLERWELALVRVGTLRSNYQMAERAPDMYCFKRPKL
jgi:hypothetical protein